MQAMLRYPSRYTDKWKKFIILGVDDIESLEGSICNIAHNTLHLQYGERIQFTAKKKFTAQRHKLTTKQTNKCFLLCSRHFSCCNTPIHWLVHGCDQVYTAPC